VFSTSQTAVALGISGVRLMGFSSLTGPGDRREQAQP